MGLTAPTKPKPVKKISLPLLLDQLDSEWAQQPQPSDLYVYFQDAARRGLHWIGGDYVHVRFPAGYETHRLPKLCAWLTGLEHPEPARAAQVAALHQVWAPYAQHCARPIKPINDASPIDREVTVRGYTWDGLDTLWQTEESTLDGQIYYLPQFHCRASENFHLVALAVLFLNRACKLRLSSLEAL